MRIKFHPYMVNYINERTGEIVNNVAANNKAFRELT